MIVHLIECPKCGLIRLATEATCSRCEAGKALAERLEANLRELAGG